MTMFAFARFLSSNQASKNRLNRAAFGRLTTKCGLTGKALLPTETEYNRKWTTGDEKWDRLDKLSHNGMPDDKDYFICIARQLEIINEIAEHVEEMLKKANSVILTGDHGSSRLAALLFHDSGNFAQRMLLYALLGGL